MFNLFGVDASVYPIVRYPNNPISLVYYRAHPPQTIKILFIMPLSAALAGVIGAGISAAGALAGTHMKNEAQKRESELAYRREQMAIREQNAYNSASAQVARLQAAGLNPNMMYSNGQAVSAGTQDDIPRYQPADIDNAFEPMGNAGSQMVQNLIGLKDMENKTALANSEILVNASTRDFNLASKQLTEANCQRITSLLGWEIQEKQSVVGYNQARIDEIRSQIELNDANINNLAAELHLKRAEIDKLDAETKRILLLSPTEKQLMDATIAERRAMVEKIALELKLSKQENIRGWISVGVTSITEIMGTIAKFIGKGASMNQLFGENPWSQDLNSSGQMPMGSSDRNGYDMSELW